MSLAVLKVRGNMRQAARECISTVVGNKIKMYLKIFGLSWFCLVYAAFGEWAIGNAIFAVTWISLWHTERYVGCRS